MSDNTLSPALAALIEIVARAAYDEMKRRIEDSDASESESTIFEEA
jgi:hypothetical protein